MRKTVHGYVEGHVQGVFFRKNTQLQAKQRDLTGWVRNLSDGRVEFLICGESLKVDDMLAWLKVGPAQSRVDALKIEEAIDPHFDTFMIK